MKKFILSVSIYFLFIIAPTTQAFFFDDFFYEQEKFWDRWEKNFVQKWPNLSSRCFSIDLEKQKNQLVATVDVFNLDPENISIKVENSRYLILRGEQDINKEDEDKKYYLKERNITNCSRQIFLPEKVDREKVEATFEDNILKIVLPILEPKKYFEEIPIEIKK